MALFPLWLSILLILGFLIGSIGLIYLGILCIIKMLTYESLDTKIKHHAKNLLNKYEAEQIKGKVNKNKDIEQINDLYAVGVNASEISRITGVPRSTVRRTLGLLK
jgi:hypothetical protein